MKVFLVVLSLSLLCIGSQTSKCDEEYDSFYDSVNILTYFSKMSATNQTFALSLQNNSGVYMIDFVFPTTSRPPRLAWKVSYVKDNREIPPKEEFIIYKSEGSQGSLLIASADIPSIHSCTKNSQGGTSCSITVTAFHQCSGIIYSTTHSEIEFKTDNAYTVALADQNMFLKVKDEDLPPKCLFTKKCKLNDKTKISYIYCNMYKECNSLIEQSYNIDSIVWVKPNVLLSNSEVATDYQGKIVSYTFDLYSKKSPDTLITTIEGDLSKVVEDFSKDESKIFGFPVSVMKGNINVNTFISLGGTLKLTVTMDVKNASRRNLSYDQPRLLNTVEIPMVVYSSISIQYDKKEKFFESLQLEPNVKEEEESSTSLALILGVIVLSILIITTTMLILNKRLRTDKKLIEMNVDIKEKESLPKSPEESSIRVTKRSSIKYLTGIQRLKEKNLNSPETKFQRSSTRRCFNDKIYQMRRSSVLNKHSPQFII